MRNFRSLKQACIYGLVLLVLTVFSGIANAQDYSPGTEGLKAASLPGPGFYYLMYNQMYSADKHTDEDGDEIHNGFEVNSFANVHRFVWITDKKILGADYGMNVIVPLVNVDIEVDAYGVNENNFNMGDITIEPMVLGWHGARYDASLGLALFVPTGDYDKDDAASIGKDHYTLMLTTGATFYFDDAKEWSISALTRYEKHFENRDLDITYGDDFTVDWGLGKQIGLFEVGVSGYAHWQITEDDGDDAASDDKDSVMGIGPELQVIVPQIKGQIRLKYYKEFNAKDTSEGDAFWLTLVKAF